MLTIYGSMLCPDCVKCREDLDSAGIHYEFLDFTDDLKHLKAFLKIRDENPLFDEPRKEGNIGIPCIVKEDSSIVLNWDMYM